jgi:hypothetical protein
VLFEVHGCRIWDGKNSATNINTTNTSLFHEKFKNGQLDPIGMLRNVEDVSSENPTELQQGFTAFDICSGKSMI